MWDPGTYLRFGEERARPYADLLARVGAERPRTVVDLGCGPGTLTGTLADRWPKAQVRGLDSSPEMIARAAASGVPADFMVVDLRDWRPEPDVDVVVCNAVLQWVPGHADLLSRWAVALPAGAWLALQVPGNYDAPSHRAMREVASQPQWRDNLAGVTGPREVPGPQEYARLLIRSGCAVDVWETTYVHLLPGSGAGEPAGHVAGQPAGQVAGQPAGESAEHPVLRWMDGTALRPLRAVLGDGPAWAAFRRALGERLAQTYPVTGDGLVYFPFRRIFAVARTGARP